MRHGSGSEASDRPLARHILDLSRLAGGTRYRVFTTVRLMPALPYITHAPKVALPLARVGSIVGEFIGDTRGIGQLALAAQFNLDTPLVFAPLVSITSSGRPGSRSSRLSRTASSSGGRRAGRAEEHTATCEARGRG